MKGQVNRVVVVGGAGYLGSTLCTHLIGLGYEVISIDAHWFGDDALRPLHGHPGFSSQKVDVPHSDRVLPMLRGCEAVIWVAGLVGDPACALDVEFTYNCNYHSTLTLANICKQLGICRFVFASSCSVYGRSNSDVAKLNEVSPTCPLSYYAKDKLACEKALQAMADDSFHPTILRLATLFGWSNRMRFDLVANVLTAKACRGEILEIAGGGQRRPFLHVKDAAAAFASVLSSDLAIISNGVFNVGADSNNHRILDIADLILSAIPSARMKCFSEAVDLRDYHVDFSKLVGTVGFRPRFSVADGITEIKQKLSESNAINIAEPLYVNEKRTRQLITEAWRNSYRPPVPIAGSVSSAA
jgi:nucleoside-diphosphate-sugar epimerase